MSQAQAWKHPDELIKLQRLKQRKCKLAARINGAQSNRPQINEADKAQLLEAKIAHKRKNPFAKTGDQAKRQKTEIELPDPEESLLGFINNTPTTAPLQDSLIRETPNKRPPATSLVLQPFDAKAFSTLLHQSSALDEDEANTIPQKFSRHLPMDWCLKTRARFFCRSELPATTLKASQMASSLTSFVRCIDTQNTCSSLDISPATRFNQATYYWQHPHIPWLTLYPRNSKENSGITVDERQRKALISDWEQSFRGLFQLLRARQCPYFYLCANLFTVLFRAAGVAGRTEIHALITPTTRGLRNALLEDGIEFSMPLKKDGVYNKSNENSFSDENKNGTGDNLENDDDDIEEEEWLESLGVDENEIRKIRNANTRKMKSKEMSDDFSENSLLLIEGVECQSFFSFLLDAKSTTTSVGRLAGVPPTLLAPVAFPRATMQNAVTRSSKVRMDGIDYHSIEVKGTIMPTFLPYVCRLLGETKETFSATLAATSNTLAFSKATQKLLEEPEGGGTESVSNDTAGLVFGKENLSDCGLQEATIEAICRTGHNAVGLLENVCYDKDHGYAWS